MMQPVLPAPQRASKPLKGFSFLRAACLVFVALALAIPSVQAAPRFETPAREVVLMDANTGAVLFAKHPDAPIPPASMSKMMTVYLVFRAIKQGRISLDDRFLVSRKAWAKGGSKMFVKEGERVRIEDLLRGVIVQSGNDAAIVLAEGLGGGSEDTFARQMTETAKEMGLTNSHFANSTGWPHPQQYMSAMDLARLARAMMRDHPEFYHLFSETEFEYNGIRQNNRNPLLYRGIDADGLKTGHTEEAGYCLTASARRGDRRLILVVTGLSSKRARAEESERILTWGFQEFENYTLYRKGDFVTKADVWLGQEAQVDLVAAEDLVVTLARMDRDEMTVKALYQAPIPAPIEAMQLLPYKEADGADRLARVIVSAPDIDSIGVPLLAGNGVEKASPFTRLIGAAKYMVLGGGAQ